MSKPLEDWQRLYLEGILKSGTYDPEELLDIFGAYEDE